MDFAASRNEQEQLNRTVATVLEEQQIRVQRNDEIDGISSAAAALAVDDHVYSDPSPRAAMEESRSVERQPDLNMTRQSSNGYSSSSGASLQAHDVDDLGADMDSSELVTVFYP